MTWLNRNEYSVVMTVLLMLIVPASSAHVHGQGQLFITQVENEWQFQFILPGGDIVGFEHKANTGQEKETIALFQQRVSNINELVALPKDCEVTHFEHSLMYQIKEPTSSEMEADTNKHKVSHKDIEITYQVICRKILQVFDVRLFKWAKSIETLQVQWVSNKGQGKAILTMGASALTF